MYTNNKTWYFIYPRLYSDIFSPISVSFYSITFIFLFFSDSTLGHFTDYITLILLLSASPLLITRYTLRLTGSTDIDIANREDRITIYKYSIVPIFIGFIYSKLFIDIHILYVFTMVVLLNIIFSFFLNFYIKLSVHLMSLSSVISIFYFYYSYDLSKTSVEIFVIGFILAFSTLLLVAISRLKLGVHSIPELLTGLSIGIINTFVIVYLMK